MRGITFSNSVPSDSQQLLLERPAVEKTITTSTASFGHSTQDWMPRDDDIDFSMPWNGEVVLSPLNFRLRTGEKNDAAALFDRAHNFRNFARVRIVRSWRDVREADDLVINMHAQATSFQFFS